MNDSLLINNMYAAYSATSSKADQNVSNLSKLLKGEKREEEDAVKDKEKGPSMDRVIISAEALELLKGSGLIN